jgi:methylenetetrahydrofolate dehydrogenase (NADP+)/methenyltetrahydrofolate cyclohydrolase
MQLLDGKLTSEKLKKEIAKEAESFNLKSGRKPHLVAILVGNNPASETYVASKVKNCSQVGFMSSLVKYDDTVTEEELFNKIIELNNDNTVDGFIVQLPLPTHINAERIIEAIDYKKDVDGFHPINLGRMQRNLPCFIPATPYGILMLLE